MNKATFKALERKLDRKNAELIEVREFRKKLDEKEKEICTEIENLQSQKVEIIFAEIKREIQTANIDVSSSSILPVLDALRKNQRIMDLLQPDENVSAPSVTETESLSPISTEKISDDVDEPAPINQIDFISDIIEN